MKDIFKLGCGLMFGVVLIGLVCVVILGASQEAEEEPKAIVVGDEEYDVDTTIEDFYINDVVYVNGVSIQVISATQHQPTNIYFAPEAGYALVAVEVEVSNLDADPGGYGNPYNFSYKDQKGYVYDYALGGKEPAVASTQLSVGSSIRGFITFEVPLETEITNSKLIFSPFFLKSPAEINLNEK
jgi:hypothetical protein